MIQPGTARKARCRGWRRASLAWGLRLAAASACSAQLASCASNHAVFNVGGPRARHIAGLMIVFLGVSALVYVIVIAFLTWALVRGGRSNGAPSHAQPEAADARSLRVVATGVALTTLVLVGLGLSDFFVQRALNAREAGPVRIHLTGHQYWWEVEYDDPSPQERLRTANELHIPVGRPVELVLRSRDVIHSFWVPSLMGKKDLIPGRTNREIIVADRPGTFTGQCAEFCGLQHAKMRLIVLAEDNERFESWKRHQLEPARAPRSDAERRGHDVFLGSSCALCHTIRGTLAAATVGPDLTHIGARSEIAAGTLPNTVTNVASWVLAPQRFKPGAQMPGTTLAPADLAALSVYLTSLR